MAANKICTVKSVFFQHMPLISNLLGIIRIDEFMKMRNDSEYSTSRKAGTLLRGIGEVLFLGTILFWLVDLIVTLGRTLQLKCANSSQLARAN